METWIAVIVPVVLGAAYVAVRRGILGNPSLHALFERDVRSSFLEEEARKVALDAVRREQLHRIRLGLTTPDERERIVRTSAEAFVALSIAQERRRSIEALRKEFLSGKLTVEEAFSRQRVLVDAQEARREALVAERAAVWKGLGDDIFNVI